MPSTTANFLTMLHSKLPISFICFSSHGSVPSCETSLSRSVQMELCLWSNYLPRYGKAFLLYINYLPKHSNEHSYTTTLHFFNLQYNAKYALLTGKQVTATSDKVFLPILFSFNNFFFKLDILGSTLTTLMGRSFPKYQPPRISTLSLSAIISLQRFKQNVNSINHISIGGCEKQQCHSFTYYNHWLFLLT